jgi:hypothetical protein
MIEGVQPISFSLLPFKTEDLDPGLSKKQQHPTDIKIRDENTLQIDLKQRGLGEMIVGGFTTQRVSLDRQEVYL